MQYPSEGLPVPAPKLLDQVREKNRLKHYSIRAWQANTNSIKHYILHFGKKHPRDIVRRVCKRLYRLRTDCRLNGGQKGVAHPVLLEVFNITIVTGINTYSYTKGDTR